MEEYNVVPGLGELVPEIDILKQEVEKLRESLRASWAKQCRLHDLLKEMADNGDIDTEVAEQIADIFDITLTKTIQGTVTVTWSFSAEVGLGETVDDLDFSAELVANGCEDYDVSEEGFDVEED